VLLRGGVLPKEEKRIQEKKKRLNSRKEPCYLGDRSRLKRTKSEGGGAYLHSDFSAAKRKDKISLSSGKKTESRLLREGGGKSYFWWKTRRERERHCGREVRKRRTKRSVKKSILSFAIDYQKKKREYNPIEPG